MIFSAIICNESLQECREKCALVVAPTFLCAQDGNLYNSSCEAFCESPNNYILASFEDFEKEEAELRCKETSNQHNCLKGCGSNRESHHYYCTNTSNIYSQLCRAKCIEPETEFLWECSRIGFDSINCRFKCTRYHQCKKQCAEAEIQKPICGSDGLFYNSQCELECNELSVINDFDGVKITDSEECLTFAKKYASEGLGPRKLK